jgi:hypothetical protein
MPGQWHDTPTGIDCAPARLVIVFVIPSEIILCGGHDGVREGRVPGPSASVGLMLLVVTRGVRAFPIPTLPDRRPTGLGLSRDASLAGHPALPAPMARVPVPSRRESLPNHRVRYKTTKNDGLLVQACSQLTKF